MLKNLKSNLDKAVNIFDKDGNVEKYVELVKDDRKFKEVTKGIFPFKKKVKEFDYDASFYMVLSKKDFTAYYDAAKKKFMFVVEVQQGNTPKLAVKFEYGKDFILNDNNRS